MNLKTKLQLLNTKAKVDAMFLEQPWFISTDVEVNPQTNEMYIIVGIDRLSHDAAKLMNTMAKIKIDRIPLKPVLKDR